MATLRVYNIHVTQKHHLEQFSDLQIGMLEPTLCFDVVVIPKLTNGIRL